MTEQEGADRMIDSTAQIAMVKTLLAHPKVAPPSGLAALGAATLAAAAAIVMAGVVVLGPGVAIDDPSVVLSR